jgi:hypothetical protein
MFDASRCSSQCYLILDGPKAKQWNCLKWLNFCAFRLITQAPDGQYINPPSGTIADDVVTCPERYDFFLVRHVLNYHIITHCTFSIPGLVINVYLSNPDVMMLHSILDLTKRAPRHRQPDVIQRHQRREWIRSRYYPSTHLQGKNNVILSRFHNAFAFSISLKLLKIFFFTL